jgi:ribosomal protein S18 acetylase RimI-like enzyme
MTIRAATASDVRAITALVEAAYSRYIERIGARPAPMDDDHARHVARGEQYVMASDDGAVVGAIVLVARDEHLFIDNVAIDPSLHGRGLGGKLLSFAEDEARRRGLPEVRLYTNAAMTENLAIYAHLGYVETGREQVGPFHRVAFAKPLA